MDDDDESASSLERPILAGEEERERGGERDRTKKGVGLAQLLVSRVLGRDRQDGVITGGDSTPGSIITTSQAAFGEYAELDDDDDNDNDDREGGLGPVSSTSTSRSTTTRLNHAVAALTNTIVGAGIVALPKAFASLGVVPGTLLLGAFFFLSRYTLAAMIRSASTVGVWTYDELVRSQFGEWGARSLDAAIVVNNLGGLIIYLIIVGDLLVGTPPFYSGIVTNALGMHGGDVWWISREFVVGVVSLLVLFPLVSLRDISGLGAVSVYSVSVAIGLVGSIGLLAVAAALEGKLATDVSVWLPADTVSLGSALAILPVIAVTFCCHYNLFPVATNLERFSDRRIAMVIRRSLMVCTALFVVLAVSGVALFGGRTEGNVLVNLRPEVVQAFLPAPLANILCLGVRLLYLGVIVSSFPMLNWALRETCSSYLFGSRTVDGNHEFLVFSFCLLLGEYALSVILPDIWGVMSLTGATAAVYVMFILPGALLHRTSREARDDIAGRLLITLGMVTMIFGVVDNL